MFPGTGLAEKYYLKPSIVAGWALAVPAPLFYALAPHWAFTVVGTLFLALSTFNGPAISVYLTLGVPKDRIAGVMTIVLSAYSLGLIVATPLSGFLAQLMGVRWLFFLSFLAFAVATVFVWFVPKRVLPDEVRIGASYRDLVRYPVFLTQLLLFSLLTVVIFIPWPFLALFARDRLAASDEAIGVLMACLYLGSVLMGLLMGRLVRSFGSMPVVLGFEAAYIVSAVAILLASSVPLLGVAFFLRGAFWSFRQVMTAVVGQSLPMPALAKGYGLFAVVTGAAAALAYPLGGWLFMVRPGMPFLVSAWAMVVVIPLTLLARRSLRPLTRRRLDEAAPPTTLPEAA
jgi:predicted MFS family arabinose efflux permease